MEFMKDFDPPTWAKCLKGAPRKKLKLAMTPTPIHRWDLPGVPKDFKVSIKRDDMTGSTLSGHKIRRLEFILAEALMHKSRHVVACGFLQSNICRSVAVAARHLGLQTHLVMQSKGQDPDSIDCSGNLLLDRLCGSRIYLVQVKYAIDLVSRAEKLAKHIKSTTGEECYLIPSGLLNVGLYGYISMFDELLSQGVADRFDDIVLTCVSGTTAVGLAIANFLTDSKLRIHAVLLGSNTARTHERINQMIQEAGLICRSEDILNMIDGHRGLGFGISTQEDLDYVLSVSSTTGIMMDPVFTLKGAKGLVYELNNNPDMFKGKRILFIHTGGAFGLHDGQIDETVQQAGSVGNRIYNWGDIEDLPIVG